MEKFGHVIISKKIPRDIAPEREYIVPIKKDLPSLVDGPYQYGTRDLVQL